MKFFIDTANLDEIREAQDLGVLDGVTTNPSLMAKEGITGEANILKHYKDICDIVDDNVSAEVIATEFDKMVAEEKASDTPFRAVVDQKLPKVDEVYSWRHFQLEHKKNEDALWTYKMKQCWFATFFIRYGRTDIIQTACNFD